MNNKKVLEKQKELLSMIEILVAIKIQEKQKYLPYISRECSLYKEG